MTNRSFVFFYGNGNDGEQATAIIEMGENDCPFAFMEVAIPSMFPAGGRARHYAYASVYVDGEEEFSIYATLHENYNGDTEMGAAFKTARLEPLKEGEYGHFSKWEIRQWLDRGTMMMYRKKLRKEGN